MKPTGAFEHLVSRRTVWSSSMPDQVKPVHRKRTAVIGGLVAGAVAITAVVIAVPWALAGQGVADLRADTNRDGVVDLDGRSDVEGKGEWTEERGAIFLPNIGDSAGRGKPSDPANAGLSDAELAAIHDANDNVPRATENFAPLRTMPIADLDDEATGTVALAGVGADKARLFLERDGEWVFVDEGVQLSREELAAGLVLGIDGRDVIRPGEWDGKVTVRFSVKQGLLEDTDEVQMRVAPVLTHHHLQEVEQVVTSSDPESPVQTAFVADLTERTRAIGQPDPVALPAPWDQWAQDYMEPGYATMPGPDGTVRSIRIIIRSPQSVREAGRQVFELRGPGVGAVQFEEGRRDEVNSMGNVETIPPYEHNGVSYPAGRIITGAQGQKLPASLEFFQAQGAQDPLVLDSNWLGIGHVDEFVQFLPADNERGWTIAVADPNAGRQILVDAQAAGHGSVPTNSRPEGDSGSPFPEPPKRPIDEYLADAEALAQNESAAAHIEENLEILLKETGVGADEVVRIPALFEDMAFSFDFGGDGTTPAEGEDEFEMPPGFANDDRGPDDPDHGSAAAYVPGAINGIVIGTDYIAPQQWGPVVDGKDLFGEAVAGVYADAGLTVHWIDDWDSHHVMGGEVHCGTNTLRTMATEWWQ
jgi:protein-arginine deiminase